MITTNTINKYNHNEKFRSYVDQFRAILSQDDSLSGYELIQAVIMATIFHIRDMNYKATKLKDKERLYKKTEQLETLIKVNELIGE